jgi:hypothetical protein
MKQEYPKISFREEFDNLIAFEVESKGWYSGVIIELENHSKYELTFYDPMRLNQDLETENKIYLSEPGLVIISKVTVENIYRAVHGLYKEGFFNSLKALNANT